MKPKYAIAGAMSAEPLESMQPDVPFNFGRPRYLTFLVAPEMVKACADWSEPVRFKFEKQADGTLTMWLQTVTP